MKIFHDQSLRKNVADAVGVHPQPPDHQSDLHPTQPQMLAWFCLIKQLFISLALGSGFPDINTRTVHYMKGMLQFLLIYKKKKKNVLFLLAKIYLLCYSCLILPFQNLNLLYDLYSRKKKMKKKKKVLQENSQILSSMILNLSPKTLQPYLSQPDAFCLHIENVFIQVLRFTWDIIKCHGEI